MIDCDGVYPPILTPDRGHEVVVGRLQNLGRRRTPETFPVFVGSPLAPLPALLLGPGVAPLTIGMGARFGIGGLGAGRP